MVLPAVCKVFNRWRRETSRPAPDAVRIGLVRADDLTGAEVLDPENVDLADLALALEDHSEEHAWWFDPATGETAPRFMPDGEEPVPDAGDRLIPVDPLPSSVGYADMEDFIAGVRDPRARDRLERAIAGRGAFRRFKDTLFDYGQLRTAWFAFHDARGEQRAIEWLLEQDLVDSAAAERAIARRSAPPPEDLPGVIDPEGIAHRVAHDLRRLYRERLKAVWLVGAWARGDAQPETEVELLVVLDGVDDRWEEKQRMDKVMWRHSVRNDTVVTERPVSEHELDSAANPALVRALAQGVQIQ
jgi:hypothetical protein